MIAKDVTYIGNKNKFNYQKHLNFSKKVMIDLSAKVALIGLQTRHFQKSEGQLKLNFIWNMLWIRQPQYDYIVHVT